jgi:oligopeptide/dipeptide ABC transporter ATP-binding protein
MVQVNPSAATGDGLDVRDLTIEVRRPEGWREAVRSVGFAIADGERVALVGESGSGKSLTAMSLGALLPPGARITGGTLRFGGHDLRSPAAASLRGREIAFVFQNPMSSLDPLVRVGTQIEETLEAHSIGDKRARRRRAIELLERVGIPDPEQRARDFPHQFSGGMRQRAMIAGALAAQPRLLVADEPTTALDVTVQAQILKLLRSLSDDLGLSLLLITHDLAVARSIADRAIVMYGGRVLETAPMRTLLAAAHHPYTQALLRLAPDLDGPAELPEPIPGRPIPAWEAGPGCPFADRCPYEQPRSSELPWRLMPVGTTHESACVVPPAERMAAAT